MLKRVPGAEVPGTVRTKFFSALCVTGLCAIPSFIVEELWAVEAKRFNGIFYLLNSR